MKELTFEESMENLEKIVKELEEGNLTLDESVKKFKEGMDLSKKCNDMISNAEKEISILIEKEDGTVVEEDFDTKE